MDFPIYYIEITDDDDSGLKFMSIVDNPAIQLNYLKFSEHLKYTTNEKQIVTGPAIVVDLPIYRKLANGQECYTVFDRVNTEKMVKKWAVQQKYNAVNTDHETPINTMFLFESYLIDRERGINPPKEFSDVPDGSWFLSYYVQDSALWDKIKAGEFNGFSVEILSGLTTEKTDEYAELLEDVQKFNATLKELVS
jgi:hypothetical protein